MENEKVKGEIFFLPDNAYFPPNVTPQQMAGYYSIYYSKFNKKRFQELCDKLELDTKRKINTFSKGMKRQVSMLLGICAGTKYLFCDETFDGLDPVMRQAAKSILAYEVTERPFTPMHIHKVQCVIQNPLLEEELLRELDVVQSEKRLSLLTLIVRGEKDKIMETVESKFPLFAEMIPLTLEEIFISETEVAGYDIKKLFF